MSTKSLSMNYKSAVTMNNIGATLMAQTTDSRSNDIRQSAVVKGLFQSALRTLHLPNNAQFVEESKQLLALSLLLFQSNMDRNNSSPFAAATLSFQPPLSSAVKLMVTANDTATCQAKLATAVILFNLALFHQLTEPQGTDIPHLYRTCAATLTCMSDSDETFLLAVACLNNVGVWCHATGDALGAQSIMEQLSGLLAAEDRYG